MENKLYVLGFDDELYTLKNYISFFGHNIDKAVGIVFDSPIIGKRVVAFHGWISEWGKIENVESNPLVLCDAIRVVSGLEITKDIMNKHNECGAASICYNYNRGNLEWYLPSVLELIALKPFLNDIDNMLEELFCKEDWVYDNIYDEHKMASCCEFNESIVFYANNTCNFIDTISKRSTFIVKPMATLPEKLTLNYHDLNSVSDADLVTELRNRGFKGELIKETKLIV